MPPELLNFTQNVILDGGTPPGNLSLLEFTQNVFFNPDDGFTPVDEAGLTLYRGDHAQPHKHFSNVDGFLDRKTQNVIAKFTWDIDSDLNFESITHFNNLKKTYLEDGDGLPVPIISFQTDMDYQQWSEELRLAGTSERLRWQLGVYYLNMKHDGLAATVGNPVIRLANSLIASGELDENYDPGAGSPQAIQDYVVDASNWSLFSQIEYELTDELVAIAGLRWSQDDKKLNYVRGFQDLSLNIPLIQQARLTPSDSDGNIDYQDYAAKLQLNWQFDPDHLVFLSYNRGIKVGNWAFSAGVPVNELEHKPETLHSYEMGIKSRFPEPSLGINLTGFYYDYQDYQAFAMLGLAPQIRNSDANVFGAELELSWQATEAFDITLGAAYLNSEVEKVNAVAKWNSPVGGTVIDFPVDHLYNVELPNSPKLSFNYIFRYQLPMFKGEVLDGAVSIQLDGAWYDEQYLEVTNGGGSYQQAYGLSNIRLSYQPPEGQWEVNLWVKNATDEVYKQYSLDLGMLGATAYYAQGRTSGISVNFQW
ncbi:MAG: iron complex outermembrane receptor protein [Phenylobacterium sp.]|jgi:iron complex outermembrane receptor protein